MKTFRFACALIITKIFSPPPFFISSCAGDWRSLDIACNVMLWLSLMALIIFDTCLSFFHETVTCDFEKAYFF